MFNITTSHTVKKKLKPIICQAFLRYRMRQELSQEQFAKTLGITVRSYIDLEHGDAFPSATTFIVFILHLEQHEYILLFAKMRAALQ